MLKELKEWIELHRKELYIGGFIVVALVVCIFGIYCNSSSETSTPKADEFGRQSANAHAESVAQESEANTISEEVKRIEAKRVAQKKKLESSRSNLQESREKLKRSKENYDKVVNQPINIPGADLDDRERVLFADLKRLYWSQ